MKRSLIYSFSLLVLAIFFSSCESKISVNDHISYSPQEPQAGNEVTIYLDVTGSKLDHADSVKMIAYLYSVDLDQTIDLDMVKSEGEWVAKFLTTDSTKGVILKFKSGDIEFAGRKGDFLIPMYNDAGNPVAGSQAGLAVAYYFWGGSAGLDRDAEKAYQTFLKSFQAHPEIKDQYLDYYLSTVSRFKPDESEKIVKTELEQLEMKKTLTETDLINLAKWYGKIDNKEKAAEYTEKVESKFPQSDFVQRRKYLKIREERNISKMIDLLNELKNEFPESKYIESGADDIVVAFKKAGEYKKALQFIKEYRTKLSSYYFYYIASAINETGKNLDISKEISKMGIDKSQMDLAKSPDEKPNDLTNEEWEQERNWYLGMNQFSLGEALNKENNNEEAIPLLGKALKNTLDYYPQEKLINLYAKLLVDEKKFEKALDEMSELITEGNATALMDDLMKEAYVGKNGSEEGFESYKSELEGKAKKNMITELKGKMIMEPSPNFTLMDLNGNKVTLSDLSGKTVVLDFWATWCGPCLRSFPGMKKAVEKYANNDKVEFLFVNTWENVDNKKENAEQFIKKNNYPFHVLLDTNNEVVTKFKVSGIPTKFIIDKAGYIRFKSVGFNGNADVMADEISTMISLIN